MTDDQFAEAARRPDEWINAARPLRVSAYLLKFENVNAAIAKHNGLPTVRCTDLLFTALFLASLSLENVIKAVLLVRKPDRVANGRIDFRVGGHDLVGLAREADFTLSKDEEDFLQISCKPCIVSFGRYPIALRNRPDAPGMWQIHDGAFGYFESIFTRGVETALKEAGSRSDRTRAVELNTLQEEIRSDVPQSLK